MQTRTLLLVGSLLALSFSSGCGRVGIELLPEDDAAIPDQPEMGFLMDSASPRSDAQLPLEAGMRGLDANATHADACVPTSTTDDAFSPGNMLDDDCDGKIDEDVAACTPTTLKLDVGAYAKLSVPGNCHSLTIELWGGAGAGGQQVGNLSTGVGGSGGAGGYAQSTLDLRGPAQLDLFVGAGGGSGACANAGANVGSSTLSGGSGGAGGGVNAGAGSAGAGSARGGGQGGHPMFGRAGGDGFSGGGGGGAGAGGVGVSGQGGGGGAASALFLGGAPVVTAGGGGGGGGADALDIFSQLLMRGSQGGSGCSGNGQVDNINGGGGGGGGVCQGDTMQAGNAVTPAQSAMLPKGQATGGDGSCKAGGNGYAILNFAK